MRAALGEDVQISVEDQLYGAEVPELMARLRQVAPANSSVMVVAHNPGMQDLAIHLAGDGEAEGLRRLRTKFPTGALATLDFGDGDWTSLSPQQGYLVSVVVPSDLA